MSFTFQPEESVIKGVQRIAHEQIDKALKELADANLDPHETVYQVRKRCKRLRGLLRLVRAQSEATFSKENGRYRDAARKLSELRDAQSLIETCDQLFEANGKQISEQLFADIRQQLVEERQQYTEQEDELQQQLETLQKRMQEGKKRIDSWSFSDKEFDALSEGFQKTYERGVEALNAAEKKPTTENFHEWRKRVKYHRYHLELLEPIWPEMLAAHYRVLKQLSDYLGDDHDLAILQETLLDHPDKFGTSTELQAITDLIDQRRQELETSARTLGQKIFAEKPKQLANRFRAYWEIWRSSSVKVS